MLRGTAAVQGVSGLSASGTLEAQLSSSGNWSLAGDDLVLSMAGFGQLSGDFAIERQAGSSAPVVWQPSVSISASQGSASTLTAGGSASSSSWLLSAASADGSRFREGSYSFSRAGGKAVTVSTLATGGAPLSDAALITALNLGLEQLYGSGSVTVSGSRSAGFTLSLGGAQAGQSLSDLVMQAPADPAASLSAGQVYVVAPTGSVAGTGPGGIGAGGGVQLAALPSGTAGSARSTPSSCWLPTATAASARAVGASATTANGPVRTAPIWAAPHLATPSWQPTCRRHSSSCWAVPMCGSPAAAAAVL